jgi:hypothetical protein
MIGNLIVRLEIGSLPGNIVWVNDLGPALIDHVSVINGDRELVNYKGLDLFTHHMLNTPNSKLAGLNRMIGHYNTKYSLHGKARTLYVPIPFFRDQFYPLFLSDAFQVRVSLRPFADVIVTDEVVQVKLVVRNSKVVSLLQVGSTTDVQHSVGVSILFDAIHLSKSERYMYNTRKGELLFQSMQQKMFEFKLNETTLSCLLDYTGTASHLIITAETKYLEFKKLDTFTLLINGVMIGEQDTDTNVYRYFNNSLCTKRYVYVIPFAMNCHRTQPSGTLTFYGRKNTVLVIKRSDTSFTCKVQITAVLIDSMQFENGMIV